MKKAELSVIGLGTLLALPFLLVLPWMALFRLLVGLFPSASPLFLLELPAYLFFSFLSRTSRYLGLSLAALLLSAIGVILVIVRERERSWRCRRFYLPALSLLSVLAFPLLMRYRPAAEAAPGVELRHVDPPRLVAGVVKSCQSAAEVNECQYEPLGWADAQTFVYKKWCGGHYQDREWYPGTAEESFAYYIDMDMVAPFAGDVDALVREICASASCVDPNLTAKPWPHFPGRYPTPLVSPDGRMVAFTARHAYGPEDLFIIAFTAETGLLAQIDGALKSI